MNKYTQILSQHSELSERVDKSTKKIHDIRDELKKYTEQNNFKPLFLLNDILRFWRTICLNYEAHREDKKTTNESGGKKNLNLRFSRKLTVFSTILPMIAKPITSIEEMKKLIKMAPLKRFSTGLDYLSDDHLQKDFDRFLNDYEYYLNHKETDSKYKDIKERAKYFSNFIFKALSHKSIDEDYKKYLII